MRVKTCANGQTLKSGGAWRLARGANRKVEEMLRAGWSKMGIARAMGYKGQRLDWHGNERIRVKTWLRFNAVYQEFRKARKAA